MTIPETEAAFGRQLLAAALKIEMAWLDEAEPTPSPMRPQLESEAEFGLTLTESIYAAGVLDLFEEKGVEGAFDQVVGNRLTLAAYRDCGAEPWEVVSHILSR
jgi:hypothetical protein